jgi:hypothetical protein
LCDARRDLQPVIGGFDTADLKDAKARLGELGKKKGVVPAATR